MTMGHGCTSLESLTAPSTHCLLLIVGKTFLRSMRTKIRSPCGDNESGSWDLYEYRNCIIRCPSTRRHKSMRIRTVPSMYNSKRSEYRSLCGRYLKGDQTDRADLNI